MHVYTDGEDWWVAESLSAFREMYEAECGQPHDIDGLREMADDEPLTIYWEEADHGETLTTKYAGRWAAEFFAKHKSGGLLATVNR